MKTTRLIGVKCKRGDAFSWHVLIGRGLDPNLAMVLLNADRGYCSVLRVHTSKEICEKPKCFEHTAGADYAEVPPVPIPNTEVKLRSAEDTWLETTRENR